ncbi:MAG TPA: paraslipin [Leptospiraceae bacterium]|nr:paraslipin [Leptospiraceae bacterium]HMX32644.1 paraslipin [Leptospiraceae bacterium]HMY30377.1 paraslipin [Leptospiraceae bacterium]HMZ65891.1 paraslipin [Leptospiraceae bacterium]HNA07090.1 paraslipin [Leptospiraceae bacterium]
MEYIVGIFWVLFALFIAFKFIRSVRIVPAQEVLIVERLGRYHQTLNAGLHFLIPFIDKVTYSHTLKEQAIEVQPQICITKDNVQVKVDGVLYLKILDAQKASYGIEDYRFAAIQLAQTTMRAVIGTLELDKTFEARDSINHRIVEVIDSAAELWGIQVNRYEIQNLTPPKTVLEAMEKQKTAELNKKAEISLSEGDRDSKINRSEGLKQEAVNKSEGEMQRRINEAEGRAKEIEAIASATAKGIEAVANAINTKNGKEAVKLQIVQGFIKEFTSLAKSNTEIVLPMNLTDIESITSSVVSIIDKEKG